RVAPQSSPPRHRAAGIGNIRVGSGGPADVACGGILGARRGRKLPYSWGKQQRRCCVRGPVGVPRRRVYPLVCFHGVPIPVVAVHRAVFRRGTNDPVAASNGGICCGGGGGSGSGRRSGVRRPDGSVPGSPAARGRGDPGGVRERFCHRFPDAAEPSGLPFLEHQHSVLGESSSSHERRRRRRWRRRALAVGIVPGPATPALDGRWRGGGVGRCGRTRTRRFRDSSAGGRGRRRRRRRGARGWCRWG
ncbi:unnamed protein product, partial [Scytosiphon promiscuus]